jgi:hypothetical protein
MGLCLEIVVVAPETTRSIFKIFLSSGSEVEVGGPIQSLRLH